MVYHKAQISEKVQSMTADITANLYVNPSYITARYDVARKPRTHLQQVTRSQNFKSNSHKGKVSKASARKIRTAIQWLVLLADTKKVWSAENQKLVPYKAGLATVSLPTGCTNVQEEFFRDTLLSSILSAMNYKFGLKNYIWKMERQGNGTLHAHITIDKFIPHEWLLVTWCKILEKHGLLEEYRSKFQAMSLRDYVNYRRARDHRSYVDKFPSFMAYTKSLIRAYSKGKSNEWKRPNCTDIHAVKKVKYLAAYMVKYMSKDPQLGPSFKGRYWACSHSLSKLRCIRVSLPEMDIPKFTQYIQSFTTGIEELYYISKSLGEPVFLGCLYFLKRSTRSLYSNPVLHQLFSTLKTLYDASNLDKLPYFSLSPHPTHTFRLHKIELDAC